MSGDKRPVLWWFAGDDADGLLAQLDEQVASDPGGARDRLISAETTSGRARLGIVDPNQRKVRLARRLVAKGERWGGRSDIWFTPSAAPGSASKVAFLFPGVEPAAGGDVIDLPGLGRALGIEAPEIRYDTVAHQGASIFQLGFFLDNVLRRLGVEPDVAAGHSVGEWAGTVAVGMIPESHANDFVGATDLENVAFPSLDFAAITAPAAVVAEAIADLDDLVISHDNCPSQTVICGPPEIVDRALARLREAKFLGQRLPFQSGFHTPAIAPAIETIRQMIAGLPILPARIPMWSATLVAPYPETPHEVRELHLRHLVEPVRFRELIERLYDEAGIRIFVQVGPGSLASFVDDTLAGKDHAAIELLVTKRSALDQMHRAVTALWVEGVTVRPEPLRGGSAAPAAPVAAAVSSPAPAASIKGNGAGAAPASAPPAPAAAGTATAPASAPVPFSLTAATDLLANAAAAGQQVLDALAARYSLAPMTAREATRQAVEAGKPASRAAAPPPPPPPPPPAPAPPRAPAKAPTQAPAAPAPTPATSTPAFRPTVPPGQAMPARKTRTGPTRPWPTDKVVRTEHLSLESRPETIDHSLYHQPEGWPDPSDAFPIIAMTTQIDILQKIAEEYGGGRDLIEVFGVRNFRWLDLSNPVDVEVTITPKGDDVLSLALGPYCRLNVRFGTFAPAPDYVEQPITNARPTTYTAEEMFERKIMFHGPMFQGIDHMSPIGDEGMLGTFTHLETPGSLLDNLGKLIAYWVIDQRGYLGEGALPTGLGKVEFFAPDPEPGTKIRCDIRIKELQQDQVRSDGVLVLPDGRLWCRVEDWTSLVFHLDELMERVYHGPGEHHVTEPQPGGWNIVRERWPGGTSRDMTARRFLCRAEREIYESMNLVEQRRWLLDTVAAKDSVRLWLKHVDGVLAWPVEITLEPVAPNVLRAVGKKIPKNRELYVTISPLNWVTATIVSHSEPRLDIEAREVPKGSSPDQREQIAREAAEALAARNPGLKIGWVAKPDFSVPSFVAAAIEVAVAWTERDDSGEAARP